MLVFGESILNDAVAIVLTNVIVESKRQFENINATKLTAYSMIGLLASSNLTTIPSVTTSLRNRNYNGMIQRNGQASLYEPNGDAASILTNENDKYPLMNDEDEDNNEPEIVNSFRHAPNIPAAKKRRRQSDYSYSYTETFFFQYSF
jgi:hypothetical protein